MILAIETSCDDSAVAIISLEGEIIISEISSQFEEHFKYGGVVPEIASRTHLQTLPALTNYTIKKAGLELTDLTCIAVTYAPGLVGSLLVGLNFAKSFAWSLDIPFFPIDHLEGHLLAPFLDNPKLSFPFISLIASGGHTHLVYAHDLGDYHLIGKTLDDAVGEAFDKGAKILGFSYPGGPILDKIASQWEKEPSVPFPFPLQGQKSFNFSYSGLKTSLRNLAIKDGLYGKEDLISYEQFEESEEGEKKERIKDVVASFQAILVKTLIKTIDRALKTVKVKNVCITGGVAANSGLRKALIELGTTRGVNPYFPTLKHCTDNAAMIAYTCLQYYKKDKIPKYEDVDWTLNASSKSPLNQLTVVKNLANLPKN